MRHTFASHFMRNGGNIPALQKILGHSTLTIRYAHLSLDHRYAPWVNGCGSGPSIYYLSFDAAKKRDRF
nr:tyrosine-type recombinase/integrase [Pseudomonas citronellolis]